MERVESRENVRWFWSWSIGAVCVLACLCLAGIYGSPFGQGQGPVLFAGIFKTTKDRGQQGRTTSHSTPTSLPSTQPAGARATTKTTKSRPPQAATSQPRRRRCNVKRGAAFKYTEEGPPSSFNPLLADNMEALRIATWLFDRLVEREGGEAVPALATSWTVAGDRRSVRLVLRRGVTWHDGKPFTAKDVAFTLWALQQTHRWMETIPLKKVLQRTEILGSHKIRVSFTRPLQEPLRWLTVPIIPHHAFLVTTRRLFFLDKRRKRATLPTRQDRFATHPIGTGPFRFHLYRRRKIILRRSEKYWRGKACFHKVMVQTIPDKNIQDEVLAYGGLDAIATLRPLDVTVLKKKKLDENKRLKILATGGTQWWYIALNHRSPILRERKVRQALLYALNRPKLLRRYLGGGRVLGGPFPKGHPLADTKAVPRPFALKKATQLLRKAGWLRHKVKAPPLPKRPRKGLLETGPWPPRKKRATWTTSTYRMKKFGTQSKELSLRLLVPRSMVSYRALLLALQSYLQEAGFRLLLKWQSERLWRKKVFVKKEYDLALYHWGMRLPQSLHDLFHSRGSHNIFHYKNKATDILLEQLESTRSLPLRRALYRALHRLLHHDLPCLFLWTVPQHAAFSPEVKDIQLHPFYLFRKNDRWFK